MRIDQGNTMLPEPALYKAAFISYGLHYVYQLMERITRKKIHSKGPHIHSKVAYGSGEHDAIRASPL